MEEKKNLESLGKDLASKAAPAVKEAAKKVSEKAEPVKEAAKKVSEKAEPVKKAAKTTAKKVATKTAGAKKKVKSAVEKAQAKAEPAKKAVEKAAEKTSEAKKTVKAAAKKTATKAKKLVGKHEMIIQYAGKSFNTDDLVKRAKEVWKKEMKRKIMDFGSVDLYVKPEENMVYFVVNGVDEGRFSI